MCSMRWMWCRMSVSSKSSSLDQEMDNCTTTCTIIGFLMPWNQLHLGLCSCSLIFFCSDFAVVGVAIIYIVCFTLIKCVSTMFLVPIFWPSEGEILWSEHRTYINRYSLLTRQWQNVRILHHCYLLLFFFKLQYFSSFLLLSLVLLCSYWAMGLWVIALIGLRLIIYDHQIMTFEIRHRKKRETSILILKELVGLYFTFMFSKKVKTFIFYNYLW